MRDRWCNKLLFLFWQRWCNNAISTQFLVSCFNCSPVFMMSLERLVRRGWPLVRRGWPWETRVESQGYRINTDWIPCLLYSKSDWYQLLQWNHNGDSLWMAGVLSQSMWRLSGGNNYVSSKKISILQNIADVLTLHAISSLEVPDTPTSSHWQSLEGLHQ